MFAEEVVAKEYWVMRESWVRVSSKGLVIYIWQTCQRFNPDSNFCVLM